MPTRRRRFSVQHDISGRERNPAKFQQSSHPEPDSELKMNVQNFVANKPNRSKHKTFPNSSKNCPQLDIVTECESSTSVMTVKQNVAKRVDKDVTASSSNIDLIDLLNNNDNFSPEQCNETILAHKDMPKNKDARQLSQDGGTRRDKYPRQHRVKVRSPKRRVLAQDARNHDDITKQTTGTNAIDWEQEIEVPLNNVTQVFETTEEEERPSNHSLDDMCRICHGGDSLSNELGLLISACSCRGTVGRVHVKCLERWLTESGKSRCELCGTRYATRRVHRYGVPRALVMWILSQNAKQLMVDSLGIMLMSPLAVLAAWLSGRTLAGLMSQDSHTTPWPLASTFVLACMTLVCYYCWIVSAATRHALGWWIWYRSQYEVRLQLQQNEE